MASRVFTGYRARERDDLHTLLDAAQVGAPRQLDEGGQVAFKGNAKAVLRAHGSLAQALPCARIERERLSIFLTFVVPELPAPIEEDLSGGILETIDMDRCRVAKQAAVGTLEDADARTGPLPTTGDGRSWSSTGCRTSSRVPTTRSATSRGPTSTGATS